MTMKAVPDLLYADLEFTSQPGQHRVNYNNTSIAYADLAKSMVGLAVETGAMQKPVVDMNHSTTIADANGVVVFQIVVL